MKKTAAVCLMLLACLGCGESKPAQDNPPSGKLIAVQDGYGTVQGKFQVYEIETKDGTLYVVVGHAQACTLAPKPKANQ